MSERVSKSANQARPWSFLAHHHRRNQLDRTPRHRGPQRHRGPSEDSAGELRRWSWNAREGAHERLVHSLRRQTRLPPGRRHPAHLAPHHHRSPGPRLLVAQHRPVRETWGTNSTTDVTATSSAPPSTSAPWTPTNTAQHWWTEGTPSTTTPRASGLAHPIPSWGERAPQSVADSN